VTAPTKDFLRAWEWAIANRASMSRGVIEWMWRHLESYEEERED
jgi:hypothetical protein